jgi:hypothetical protein
MNRRSPSPDFSFDIPTPHWRKSSICAPGSRNCVEVALIGDTVAVRDTKHRDGGALIFSRGEWQAFIGGVRQGEFE